MWPPRDDYNHFNVSPSANLVTDAMAGANRLYNRKEWEYMVRASDQDEYDHRKELGENTEHVRTSQARYEHLQSEVPRLTKLMAAGRDVMRDNAAKMAQMSLQIAKLQDENRRLGLVHA